MMAGHLQKLPWKQVRETPQNLHLNQFTYNYYAIQFQHAFYDFVEDL